MVEEVRFFAQSNEVQVGAGHEVMKDVIAQRAGHFVLDVAVCSFGFCKL